MTQEITAILTEMPPNEITDLIELIHTNFENTQGYMQRDIENQEATIFPENPSQADSIINQIERDYPECLLVWE